jgi:hypothetical protein
MSTRKFLRLGFDRGRLAPSRLDDSRSIKSDGRERGKDDVGPRCLRGCSEAGFRLRSS